ncbi:hypothetical protein FSB65_23755 [Paraburkholderia sp. JPY418]|nr:hypothetical protein [Paraburkholderia youngii]
MPRTVCPAISSAAKIAPATRQSWNVQFCAPGGGYPDRFTFNINAFRLFTGHQTDRTKLPKDQLHGRNQEVWNIKDAAASSRIN